MRVLGLILVALIAAMHVFFAYFEIFAWETIGPRVFKTFPAELFEPTLDLAANQGIYNSFLAAGLIWSLFIKDAKWQFNIATCFLLFVIVAGLFGAATVSVRIAFVQALPAAIAWFVLWRARSSATNS